MEESSLEKINGSSLREFWLTGLSEDQIVQRWLFVLFLAIYIATVTGNLFLVLAWALDPRLQTPMYFFLINLSVLDVCYSSVIVPNMLLHFLVRWAVSYTRCTAQMYIYLQLAVTECVLLAVMAYDRFVAILLPLRYTVIMSKCVCITLAACCWSFGSLVALVDTYVIMRLPLCGPNVINHYFCESASLLRLACVDTYVTELVIICIAIFTLIIPSLFILISYVRIIATIIGIRSSEARSKAFSTCVSHLTVVTIFYSTAIFMYMKPVSKDTADRDKMISVFYTVSPPLMNPLIYSLRNKDVKRALKNISLKHT